MDISKEISVSKTVTEDARHWLGLKHIEKRRQGTSSRDESLTNEGVLHPSQTNFIYN